jgi:hypothetical protein
MFSKVSPKIQLMPLKNTPSAPVLDVGLPKTPPFPQAGGGRQSGGSGSGSSATAGPTAGPPIGPPTVPAGGGSAGGIPTVNPSAATTNTNTSSSSPSSSNIQLPPHLPRETYSYLEQLAASCATNIKGNNGSSPAGSSKSASSSSVSSASIPWWIPAFCAQPDRIPDARLPRRASSDHLFADRSVGGTVWFEDCVYGKTQILYPPEVIEAALCFELYHLQNVGGGDGSGKRELLCNQNTVY